jgi:outer membrane immunogenic protein
MRKYLVGSAAACGLIVACVAPVSAADLGARAPVVAAPLFSWTGLYLGVHAGYGWGDIGSLSPDGGFGGGQIGYNFQTGNVVFGIEFDGAWADISESATGTVFGIPATASYSVDGLLSLRGRIGFTPGTGNVLLYATGGAGWGHGDLSGTSLGVTVSGTNWHSGWTAGAGVEWAFAPKWSAKLEYLHYGLGGATYFGIPSTDLDVDTVKVGLNYHF